jgi:hypothetical protein
MAGQQMFLQTRISVGEPFDRRKIHRFVNEEVGASGEADQVVAVGRIA